MVENLTGRQLREEAEATVYITDHQKVTFGGIDSDGEIDVDKQERMSALVYEHIVETKDINRKRPVREVQNNIKRATEMSQQSITQCKTGASDKGSSMFVSAIAVHSWIKAVCQTHSAHTNQSTIRIC
jgi:hypothetical protein